MGRFPKHGYGKTPDPLAFGLDVAFGTHRGFEDERSLGTSREHTDVVRRRPAANFLVRVDEDHGRQRRLEMKLADSAQCQNDLGESPFHIEHTGTTDCIAVHGKRPLIDRPYRPNCIEVSDQELVAAIAGTLCGSSENVPGTATHPRFPHDVTDIHQRAGQYAAHAVMTLRVCGR